MSDIEELIEKIKKFRDERDWKKYHNNKDMAISIIIEASELLEHFQWDSKNTPEYIEKNKEKIGEEIADVAIYLFELADNLGLNIKELIEDKLKKNAEKYPVDKAKGSDKKYNEL